MVNVDRYTIHWVFGYWNQLRLTHPATENRRETSRLKSSPKLPVYKMTLPKTMSSPLPTAARTQGASKRVVAQRDAGVADAQWLELLWALRQVHAAGWVDQMRLTMPTLAQSNFGRKWAVQWLGRGAIPKGKVGKFRSVGFQEVPPWSPEELFAVELYFGLLIGAGSNPCCKAFYPNDRLFTLQCFAAGLAVPRHPHSQDILLGKWSVLQRTTRPSPSNTDGTHGRRDADGLPSLLPTTSNTIRHHSPHSHNISTPLQRPFSGPRRTSRHISHACRPLPTANGLYGRRSFPIFNRYVSSREGRWWLWITPPKKIDGWKDVSYGPFEKVRSISFREGSNSFKKTTFYRYVLQSIVLT